MKLRFLLIILVLLFLAAGATSAIELNFSNDQSTFRCRGGIVSLGDLDRTVRDKCDDPLTVVRRPSDSYDYWIYTIGASRYMYYLGFLHGKLQRIFSIPCRNSDPDCFDLR